MCCNCICVPNDYTNINHRVRSIDICLKFIITFYYFLFFFFLTILICVSSLCSVYITYLCQELPGPAHNSIDILFIDQKTTKKQQQQTNDAITVHVFHLIIIMTVPTSVLHNHKRICLGYIFFSPHSKPHPASSPKTKIKKKGTQNIKTNHQPTITCAVCNMIV